MKQADAISIMHPSGSLNQVAGVAIKRYGVVAEPSMLAVTLKTFTRILYGPYKSIGENEDFIYPGL